ncbi:MAG: hypothetical protein MK193_11010 [Lentisphaeria bacterium]|nr:hypothetical protein [Lentisphaeria bacterium]
MKDDETGHATTSFSREFIMQENHHYNQGRAALDITKGIVEIYFDGEEGQKIRYRSLKEMKKIY